MSCLETAWVIGHSRDPVPPARRSTPIRTADLRGPSRRGRGRLRHGSGLDDGGGLRCPVDLPAVDVLVTGGAGFIGSHYVRTLLSGGYPGYAGAAVTVLDKRTYSGNRENLAPVAGDPGLTFVEGDIVDRDLVEDLVRAHDVVVHFAAESHVDRSIAGAEPFVVTNVLGTQRLLDAARSAGIGRFLHVSTDEVYGSI